MKTEMIIVRHGETKWNNLHKYQGTQDIELNETGCKQAQKAGRFLRNKKIDYVYASDLKRAEKTAQIISKDHDLQVNTLSGLREINFGEWEGMNYKEIEKDYPRIFAKWKKDPTSVSPPGGEMVAEFQDRVVNTLEKILSQQQEDNTLLVVSHGGAIRVMMAYYLLMPLRHFWRIDVDNASVSKIVFFDKAPIIKLVNCTTYL